MNENKETLTLLYKTDIPNVNGYIYPRETVRKAFDEYSHKIETRRALGMLGQDKATSEVDILKTSHKIIDIKEADEGFYITAELTNTEYGKKLSQLLESKAELKFGLRTISKLSECGVVSDSKIVSIDLLLKD